VRPERISLDPLGSYEAILLDDLDLGSARELTLSLGEKLELTMRTTETGELEIGSPLRVEIDPADVVVWPLTQPLGDHQLSSGGSQLHGTG